MKTIPLSNGGHAIVDDRDYEDFAQYAWHQHLGYPRRSVGQGRNRVGVYMHQFIMPPMPGFQVDHIDGNKLDNRRANLRYATPTENKRNRKRRKSFSSRYMGVSLNRGKWVAQIRINGKQTYLGRFDDEEEAARRRDELALLHHGEFASLNFPIQELAEIAA